MIVDTSAFVAILYREPEAHAFVERIYAADLCRISVANYVELSMVIESQLGSGGMRQAEAFFRRAGVVVEPVTLEHGESGPAGLSRLRQGPAQGGPELRRLLLLRARQGHRRSPPVQGRRLRPDRHQGRMSRPSAPPELEQPGRAPLPARLEPLVETARAYARAATSENTNRAYAADWRHFAPGPAGKTSLPCPRIRKFSASTSPPAPPARPARSRARSAPSSGACRR